MTCTDDNPCWFAPILHGMVVACSAKDMSCCPFAPTDSQVAERINEPEYLKEPLTLHLCTHGTASGIVEFHEATDDEEDDGCPPYGSASLTITRGHWNDLGAPAELQVALSVRDGAPRVGDGGDYVGWTRPFPWSVR